MAFLRQECRGSLLLDSVLQKLGKINSVIEKKKDIEYAYYCAKGFPSASEVKNPPVNAGDVRDRSLISGLGRSSGEGNGNPLQYSCLENPMDRGAWEVTVHGLTIESDTA